MKKNDIYMIALALVSVLMSGCQFLDKNPDMRASIDTKTKVQLLLVSAYTTANYGPICEFSSDQVIDNNAPDKTGHCNNLNPLDKMYDEIFAWEDIKSDGNQDSPKYIWDGCYSAIATCNHALKAIAELEAKGISMDEEKGEALISRAYHHFILVNVFCHAWKDEEQSKKDLGITYMTEPETTVAPHYERGTVYETYQRIQEDIEAGLPLVSDRYYSVPRYHFNVNAAHAFAARFYLYTRQWNKVIAEANHVLPSDDPSVVQKLYDASRGSVNDPEVEQLAWIDPTQSYNLLLNTTMSQASYTIIPSYCRYMHNGSAADYSSLGAGPCWKGQFPGYPHWQYKQEYGTFCAKFLWLFEYTDKVNGYGYLHGVTRAFNTNETLLCRAEAKVMTNDFEGAVRDLRLWCEGYNGYSGRMDTLADGKVELTLEKIQKFYAPSANKGFVPDLHNQDMSPEFIVTAEQLPLIHCVLHFRRIETLHDGLRWLDIKRYGIEITHQRGKEALRTLTWNDDRRALQLPVDVRIAGMTPNPRVIVGDKVSPSSATVAPMPVEDTPIMLPFTNIGTQGLTIHK